jgi:hypothetical protein
MRRVLVVSVAVSVACVALCSRDSGGAPGRVMSGAAPMTGTKSVFRMSRLNVNTQLFGSPPA